MVLPFFWKVDRAHEIKGNREVHHTHYCKGPPDGTKSVDLFQLLYRSDAQLYVKEGALQRD